MRRTVCNHSGALLMVVGSLLPASAAAQAIERQVYVTVTGRDGATISDLTPADFTLREGRDEREIVSVVPARARMRMTILVEEDLTAAGGVRIGLAEFIQRMQPHAEMALVVMGIRNFVVVDYTTDIGALFDAIRGFAPVRFGQQVNNVPEGVYEAARAFERDRPGRPVIVVVARELQQESSEQPQHVLDRIGASGALVEVVSVAGSETNLAVGRLGDMSARAQILGDGSLQSGGRRIEVAALTAVSRALQEVADSLLSQYLITYVLPPGTRPSDRLDVDLKREGATLRAPSRISRTAAGPGD